MLRSVVSKHGCGIRHNCLIPFLNLDICMRDMLLNGGEPYNFLLCSIATCGYIVLQFLKLSPQESQQDPIYFVLLRNRKKDGTESKRFLSIVSARVLFTALGCLMLGTLIYTIATDGSPFRRDVLTPWMSATLIDFYVNVFALSVWVAYKESNWKTAALWIILLICFGSISTCAYIVLQLFHLSSGEPVFLVLFSSNSRQVCNYDGNSIAQTLLVY
ncbi:UNVERIFIED_CONTAM: hypothetical protein Sradi_3864000 [Sesamum radiatum]|uniref:Uncharacterized protein n=1 Tax=Sesamum radiatum TaxID=300843 RepID=A0AAW2Q255_SESRA